MALPERRNPDAPRIHVDDIGDEQEVERSSRGGWRWWWIWAVVAGLVIWWATWGWDGSGGYMRSRNNSQPVAQVPGTTVTTHANVGTNSTAQDKNTATANSTSANAQESGPGVQILAARDKKTYIGKHFEAMSVPVQQKVNDHAMWIGAANEPMLAVVSKTGNDAAGSDANSGSMVNATGTVEKAPSEAQAKREWSLSNQDAQRLEKEGAYIQVSQLTAPEH